MELTKHGKDMILAKKLRPDLNTLPIGVKVVTDFDETYMQVGLVMEGDLVMVFDSFSMPVSKTSRLHTVDGWNMDLNIPTPVYDQVIIEALMGGMIPSTGSVGTPTVIQGPPPDKKDSNEEA